MMLSIGEIEDIFLDAGWEPEYCNAGEPLSMNSFELTVNGKTVYVEMLEVNPDSTIQGLRICAFDENGVDLLDAWDVEAPDDQTSILEDVREFVESI